MTGSGSPALRPAGRWHPAAAFVVAHSVLLAVAGLAGVGLLVFDDYGMATDEGRQRRIGQAAVNYMLGDTKTLLPPNSHNHRYYGVVFEVPLVLIERLLGLTDSRAIYLSRHLITHLCFLAGAGAAAGLVSRLFASRWLAVVAVAVLVLQPRLYAHSFFNTKDIPFLVAFLLGLALIQRACERERLGAFVLCGVGVGIATNLRIMGLGLFVAVVAVRGLDWVLAGSRAERQRVMVTVGGFVGAGVLTLYVVSPHLWHNPLEEMVATVRAFSQYHYLAETLFQGAIVRWPDIPASYLPTWLGITTPPVVLVLGLIGVACVLSDGLRHPGQMLRNTPTRFGVLLVACLLLPIVAVIVLNANVYNGWRHLYFLAAPLGLLAVSGLRGLAAGCPWPLLRAGVCGLAGAGLAVVGVEMVWLHPHQAVYFNRLVDRRTPDSLRWQYDMDYWGTAHREGLDYLLHRYPASSISLVPDNPNGSGRPSSRYTRNRLILPKAGRHRIVFAAGVEEGGDFYLTNHMFNAWHDRVDRLFAPLVYTRQVYHNTILTVSATNLDRVDTATAEPYRQLYRTITAGEPLLRSEFDLYLEGRTLTWVKTPCRPADVRGRFVVHIVPVDPADAAGRFAWDREQGIEVLSFIFPDYGVRLDGACLIRRTLPAYPIRALEAHLYNPWGADRWRVAVDLSPAGVNATDVYQETYRAAVAGVPVARSHFDLYLAGRTLRYAKAPCRLADTRAGFFLQVFPRDRAVLGAAQRAVGFAALDFDFRRWRYRRPHVTQVLRVADRCLAVVRLPAYPLAGLRTGQVGGAGGGWAVDLAFSAGAGPGLSLQGVPQ